MLRAYPSLLIVIYCPSLGHLRPKESLSRSEWMAHEAGVRWRQTVTLPLTFLTLRRIPPRSKRGEVCRYAVSSFSFTFNFSMNFLPSTIAERAKEREREVVETRAWTYDIVFTRDVLIDMPIHQITIRLQGNWNACDW